MLHIERRRRRGIQSAALTLAAILALADCSASQVAPQDPASQTQRPRRRRRADAGVPVGDGGDSLVAGADDDAGLTNGSAGADGGLANPCSASARPPLRLPDGGINPEGCVGMCSLVPHAPGEADGGAPMGHLDLRLVDRALRREARQLYGCFERAVVLRPDLASQGGTVNVRFIVAPNGRVVGNPATSGMDDFPEVRECLARRISYVVFPPPTGGSAEVAVPFNFGGPA